MRQPVYRNVCVCVTVTVLLVGRLAEGFNLPTARFDINLAIAGFQGTEGTDKGMFEDVPSISLEIAQLVEVVIKLLSSVNGGLVVDNVNRTGHVGEYSRAGVGTTGFLGEGVQKFHLEVVEVVIGAEEDELLGWGEGTGTRLTVRLVDSAHPEPILLCFVMIRLNLGGEEDSFGE